MAKQEITYEDILKDIKNRKFYPIYYLMGEEPYYIDCLSEYMAKNILSESEKEFNQTIIYGSDTDMATIINMAKRYPMMSEYQVIIVKEAQTLKNIEQLSYYLQRPLASTILVLCHKHGVLDRRKKITVEIERTGILYESKKLKETQLPSFITTYLKRKGLDIEPKSTEMLTEFIGTDLSRLSGELEKLIITLPQEQKRITPDLIEKNIGISKDYNNFELKNALIEKNIFKANQIVKYFEENPKTNPLQVTLSLLFNFYSNLMLAYYAPQKNEQSIATQLGLKTPWQAKDYMIAMTRYSGIKVMQIITDIRICDAKSKGIGNSSVSNGNLLKELIFKILH